MAPEDLNFKLLHVGVAVPAVGPATETLQDLFGYSVISGPFDDPIQRVSVNFLTHFDENKVEVKLVAPLTDDAPIRSLLSKTGGGGYHLCFETSEIKEAIRFLTIKNCLLVSQPAPAVAFDGRRIAFIEACAEAAELFEVGEGAFDAVALAVEGAVEASLYFSQAARRDDGFDTTLGQRVQDGIGVVALIGDHGFRPAVAQQRQRLGAVMCLATGGVEAERQPHLVGK